MKVNYDHPKAFDWKLMESQLIDLKNGKSIEKPIYDFTQHNRSGKFEIIVPKDLVVCEGIMALVNKRIRALSDLILLSLSSSLLLDLCSRKLSAQLLIMLT